MRNIFRFLGSVVLLFFAVTVGHGQSNYATPYTFTTLAGNVDPRAPFLGGYLDGIGDATKFNYPKGVAVDSAGNVYVADTNNSVIRKITMGGVVTTLAGAARSDGSRDGTGSAAQFWYPQGVAVDNAGNVYVADTDNQTIRKITNSGVVTTLAGLAGVAGSVDGVGNAARFSAPTGVAVDSAGNVYVADKGNQTIRKITNSGVVTTLAGSAASSGAADGTGSAVRFWNPQGIAVDSVGNLYVADRDNHIIRKITSGGLVTTLAGMAGGQGSTDGTGSAARFRNPQGVAVDNAGNVYVADSYNLTVRKITSDAVVTTLAGAAGSYGSADGTGSAVRFAYPSGVAVDNAGNVYVANTDEHTIRWGALEPPIVTSAKSASGTIGLAFSYTPTVSKTLLGYAVSGLLPAGISFNPVTGVIAGTPTVLGSYPVTISAINGAGTSVTTLTVGINNYPTPYTFTTLAGKLSDYSDGGNNIYKGLTDGTGSAARFCTPWGVAVDSAGNIYVADMNNYTIRKVSNAGVVTKIAGAFFLIGSADGTGSAARFNNPYGLAVDNVGNIYVADGGNSTIRKITNAGVVTTLAGSPGVSGSVDGTGSAARFNSPYGGLAADQSGNLFFSDYNNNTIRKITSGGVVTTVAGLPGVTGSIDGIGSAARFNGPAGIAADSAGNVYVVDYGNSTVRKITSSGVVTTLAGAAGMVGSADGIGALARFNYPYGIAVDSSGNVYVSDKGNHTIRKITSSGTVTTLAGTVGQPYLTGYWSHSTDGTGMDARFDSPAGIAVDSAGYLYVADTQNNAIRMGILTPPGPPIFTSETSVRGFVSQDFLYTVTFSNAPFRYSADGLPAGLSFDTATGLISGAPAVAGSYAVVISATNLVGTGSGTLAFTVTTLSAPKSPTITSVVPGHNRAIVYFTPPTDNGGAEITLYTVTANSSGGAPTDSTLRPLTVPDLVKATPTAATVTATGTSSPITVTGLLDGTTYTFTVTATNSAGTGTASPVSAPATPTITVPDAPTEVIATPGTGSAVVYFSPPANDGGAGITSYVVTAIPGGATATGSTSPLFISGLTNGVTYTFTVTATNSVGTSTPSSATSSITPSASSAIPTRLTNLSVRIGAGTGDSTLIVGFVVGGAGTSGTKPLLIRAVGPTLASYGVTGTLIDPTLELIPQGSSTLLASNDNWSGDAQITSVGNTLGAFPMMSAVSKDAALYLMPSSGVYTAKVTGVGGTSGIALAEIYDASSIAYSATTPRLTNVSARAQVGTGDGVLIAGFVVGGTASRTVLIRAVGPTLGTYGVSGVLADPQLELTQTVNGATVVVATNDNWAGDAQITSVGTTVGAFSLSSASSKDAAILVTLPPGVYSAKASGVGNTTGVALIEVYEVP